MTDSGKDRTTIASADLEVLSRLTAARFADRAQEARRLEQIDEVNGAVAALSRSLAALSHHTISECRGSHSKWDVTEDGRAFYAALSTYATLVRTLAAEYGAPAADAADAGSAKRQRRNLSII